MSLQTSGWVGHQFNDGVFGGTSVPSDPCFIIIFWEMPELVPRIFSFVDLKSTLSRSLVLEKETFKSSMTSMVWTKLRSLSGVSGISYSKNVALFCAVENMRNKTL